MEQIKIDVVKQWLINKKEFSPLEVIEELEKENKQLKQQIENYQLAENESKEIIAELKVHCKTVDEVNEKMKCCGNCINRGLEKNISFPCDRCKRWHRKENYNDYWELADEQN